MNGGAPDGWYPDPYGGTGERRWDGTTWTAQVRPAPAPPAPSGGSTSQPRGSRAAVLLAEPMRHGLRERLHRERPPSTLEAAMSALGGALASLALFLVLLGDEGGRPAAVTGAIILIAVAYALALVGPEIARPAALAAAVIGPLVLAFTLFDGLEGRSAAVIPALIAGTLWLVALLAPGLRGAPVLVAGVLLASWLAVVGMTAGDSGPDPILGPSSTSFDSGFEEPSSPFDGTVRTFQDTTREAGSITLVLALGACVAGTVLDARGWKVLATPFLAVAVALAVIGLSMTLTGSGGGVGAAFLVVAVGVVIAASGGLGQRRGSTWIGAALAGSGLVALVVEIVDEPRGAGVLLLLVAAALVVGAAPVQRNLAARTADAGGAAPQTPTAF